MPNRLAMFLTLALWLTSTASSPASALTLCIGPCDSVAPPGPTTVITPPDLAEIDLGSIEGIVIGPGAVDVTVVATGSIIVHVPSGSLQAGSIDWRAGDIIDLSEPIDIDVGSGSIGLCTFACEPFDWDGPVFDADPFYVTVTGPLAGAFELEAGGSIIVTTTPVPEPGTGVLVGIGAALIAVHAQRVRGVVR